MVKDSEEREGGIVGSAHGIGDSISSTSIRLDSPVIVRTAVSYVHAVSGVKARMWHNPATSKRSSHLITLKVLLVGIYASNR